MAPSSHRKWGPALLSLLLLMGPRAHAAAAEDKGPAPRIVYSIDFARPVGAEWSSRQTAVTPKGGRRFLGPFANHQVSLTLKRLPAHAYVRVSFDLLIMMTWDGGDLRDPDVWNLRVKDGPKLICCTFGNSSPGGPRGRQTFPHNLPGPLCPTGSGASAEATLGYVWRGDRLDSVYRLCPVFPHTAKQLTLVFSGSALQELSDESWGLAEVKVEVLSGPRRLAEKELSAAWKRLLSDDPVKAFEALWTLVLAGDQAAASAAKHVQPTALDKARVRRLVAQLDAEEWKQREQATTRLRQMGSTIAPILAEVLRGKVSLEVRARVEQLLKDFAGAPYGAREVRHLRMIRLMELLGSPKAASVLARIGQDASSEEVRCLAGAAARRLAGTPRPEWIDLLRRVDPHTHRANGEWAATASALYTSPVPRARLALPVAPRGDYELIAEFMRKQGTGEVNFILPVGPTGVMLSLDDHDGKSYLQNIDGRDDTRVAAPELAPGRRQRLRVVVKSKGQRAEVLGELNGRQVVHWRGATRSLSIEPGWSNGRRDVLGLGVHESVTAFYRLELRMLSGKADVLPPQPPAAPPPVPIVVPIVIDR